MKVQELRSKLVATKQLQAQAIQQIQALMGNDPAIKPAIDRLKASGAALDEGIAELDSATLANAVSPGLLSRLAALIIAAIKALDWWRNHS